MSKYLKNYTNLNDAKADDTIVSPNVSLIAKSKVLHLDTHTRDEGLEITGDNLEDAQIAVKSNTISFTVMSYGGNNYMQGSWTENNDQCDPGMTIGEFINSQYNIHGYLAGFDIQGHFWSAVRAQSEIEEALNNPEDMSTVIVEGSTHCYYWFSWCLLGDTAVTMADGSTKQIKDIVVGDEVLSLNLETGEEVVRKVVFTDAAENKSTTVWDEWEFSDGTILKTAYRHEFFNVEANRFKYMDEWQIGEHTLKQDGTTPKLVKHTVHEEVVNHYKITLEESNNYFANGCLTGDRYCNEKDIKVLKAQ